MLENTALWTHFICGIVQVLTSLSCGLWDDCGWNEAFCVVDRSRHLTGGLNRDCILHRIDEKLRDVNVWMAIYRTYWLHCLEKILRFLSHRLPSRNNTQKTPVKKRSGNTGQRCAVWGAELRVGLPCISGPTHLPGTGGLGRAPLSRPLCSAIRARPVFPPFCRDREWQFPCALCPGNGRKPPCRAQNGADATCGGNSNSRLPPKNKNTTRVFFQDFWRCLQKGNSFLLCQGFALPRMLTEFDSCTRACYGWENWGRHGLDYWLIAAVLCELE